MRNVLRRSSRRETGARRPRDGTLPMQLQRVTNLGNLELLLSKRRNLTSRDRASFHSAVSRCRMKDWFSPRKAKARTQSLRTFGYVPHSKSSDGRGTRTVANGLAGFAGRTTTSVSTCILSRTLTCTVIHVRFVPLSRHAVCAFQLRIGLIFSTISTVPVSIGASPSSPVPAGTMLEGHPYLSCRERRSEQRGAKLSCSIRTERRLMN